MTLSDVPEPVDGHLPADRFRLSPVVADRLLAAAALLLHLISVRTGASDDPDDRGALVETLAALLPFALALPLLRRRQRPALVLVVVTLAYVAYAAGVRPMVPFAVFAALYAVGAFLPDRSALRYGASAIGVVAVAMGLRATFTDEGSLVDTGTNVVLMAAALLIGAGARARRASVAAALDRAAYLERERHQLDEAATVAERLRIARELHDVAAHGMSLVAMQASSARLALQAGDSARALPALELVEQASRSSLTEMRRLLTVLRSDTTDAPLGPAPGLADLSALGDGLPVTFSVDVDPSGIPGGASLTAYRIVQEALSNVRRHGVGVTAVSVRVGRERDVLVVSVEDDGRSDGAAGSGYGLLGMRERVAVYGGTLDAGAVDAGGWRVTARIPLPEAS